MKEFIIVSRSPGFLITVDSVRDHLNLFDDTSYDTMLESLISVAQYTVEEYVGEFLEAASIRQPYVDFKDCLPLVHRQVSTTGISVTYRSSDGTQKTVPSSVYVLDNTSAQVCVRLAQGQQWPSDIDMSYSAPVSVNYTAQWTSPPIPLQQAMLLLIGDMFAYRNNSSPQSLTQIPTSVRYLIAPYISRRV